MALSEEQLDRLAVDTIRTLAIDTVQQANSGHPGAPMGMAPMAYVLWTRFLRHAPTHPDWPDRDRFVLSAGHASALLYALLHLTGYDLPLAQLERFRQWGSLTPGHPEWGVTPGVEATTGPLGQGFANGIGMAIAERRLAAEFDRDGHPVVDHRVYGIVSDGDLQEGISSEAASLAGRLRLGRVVYLWDDNRIQLDGPTSMAWNEDVLARFDAYGWHTSRVEDGNDLTAIEAAVHAAVADRRPSLIAVRTHIGFGSPHKQDSQKAHGAPLGADEVRLVKEAYGWDPDRSFYVPDEVAGYLSRAIPYGEELIGAWDRRMAAYRYAFPAEAAELERRLDRGLPGAWREALPAWEVGSAMGTRNASLDSIAALAVELPELFGGAADLSESNLTDVKGGGDLTADAAGRNIRFGVREHAMGGDRERHRLPRRPHPVRGDVPHVQRLHARLRAHRRARGPARRVRLDPRLGGTRRGRAHAPACGAGGRAAHDAEPVGDPSGGRQRDVGRLGGRGRASRRPGRARADAPEGPHARVHRGAGDGRGGAWRVRRARRAGRRGRDGRPGPGLRGDGLGGPPRGRRGRGACRRGDPGSRREPAVLGALRAAGRRLSRRRAPAGVHRARDRGGRRHVRVGPVGRRRRRDRGHHLFGASAPGPEVLERFGFTAERLAEIGRAVARGEVRGRVALPATAADHGAGHRA